MWIMLHDAFFSIVRKDAPAGNLLVRARRPDDISKVFGRRISIEQDSRGDYGWRARIHEDDVATVLKTELQSIKYPNFKDSVTDKPLHDAYMQVWLAMSKIQDPPPYSGYTARAVPSRKPRRKK